MQVLCREYSAELYRRLHRNRGSMQVCWPFNRGCIEQWHSIRVTGNGDGASRWREQPHCVGGKDLPIVSPVQKTRRRRADRRTAGGLAAAGAAALRRRQGPAECLARTKNEAAAGRRAHRWGAPGRAAAKPRGRCSPDRTARTLNGNEGGCVDDAHTGAEEGGPLAASGRPRSPTGVGPTATRTNRL